MSGVDSISVLISTFNRCNYLRECLDSIFAQTRPPDQVIVIDDGSDDRTADVARSYADVRYLQQANSGKSVALNRGMEYVTSSHVCFFDDDDFMLPEALARHSEALDESPIDAYSYSPHLVFAEKAGDRISDPAHWQPVTLPQSAKRGEIFVKTLEWGDEFLTFLQGMLIPAELVKAMGGFDAKLFRGQDYDMMLRLAQRLPAINTARPTFVMRNHGGARGPARDRHSAEQRFEVWHHYDQQIVLRYRDELPLGDYLPSIDLTPGSALSASRRRRALITRCRIMFSHGLFKQGLEDLRIICDEPELTREEESEILHSLRKTANFKYEYLAKSAIPMARALRRIQRATRTSMPLSKYALKGMYWSLANFAKCRDLPSVTRLSVAVALLSL